MFCEEDRGEVRGEPGRLVIWVCKPASGLRRPPSRSPSTGELRGELRGKGTPPNEGLKGALSLSGGGGPSSSSDSEEEEEGFKWNFCLREGGRSEVNAPPGEEVAVVEFVVGWWAE